MITAEILDIQEFHVWLLSHHPNSWIGYTNNPCDCPIANYVKSKVDVPKNFYVTVSGTVVGLCDFNFDPMLRSTIPLPEWARLFIGKIDSNIAEHVNTIVTASQALDILSEVSSQT